MKQRKKRDKLMRYFKFRNVNGELVPFSRDPVQVFQIILSNQFENKYNYSYNSIIRPGRSTA